MIAYRLLLANALISYICCAVPKIVCQKRTGVLIVIVAAGNYVATCKSECHALHDYFVLYCLCYVLANVYLLVLAVA